MPGTKAGAAKRQRCPECGQFKHSGRCGTPGPKPTPPRELIEQGRVIETSGCHSYHGGHGRYPQVNTIRIARFLLGLQPGDGMEARHTCDNDWCINPEHLLAGTSQDNSDDMVSRGRSQRGERHWNYKDGRRVR